MALVLDVGSRNDPQSFQGFQHLACSVKPFKFTSGTSSKCAKLWFYAPDINNGTIERFAVTSEHSPKLCTELNDPPACVWFLLQQACLHTRRFHSCMSSCKKMTCLNRHLLWSRLLTSCHHPRLQKHLCNAHGMSFRKENPKMMLAQPTWKTQLQHQQFQPMAKHSWKQAFSRRCSKQQCNRKCLFTTGWLPIFHLHAEERRCRTRCTTRER